MNEKNIKIATLVLEMIIKYGYPLAMKILSTLDSDDPTPEDIKRLASRVPHPDEFEEEEEDA